MFAVRPKRGPDLPGNRKLDLDDKSDSYRKTRARDLGPRLVISAHAAAAAPLSRPLYRDLRASRVCQRVLTDKLSLPHFLRGKTLCAENTGT